MSETRPYRYTFFFLALFTLVSFGRIQDLHPVLYSIPLGIISVVLTLVAFLLEATTRGGIPAITAREERLVLALFALGLVTIPTSIWPGHSFEILFKRFMGTVIIFFVVCFTVKTEQDVRRVVWLLLLNTGVLLATSFKAGISHDDVGSSMYDANDFALVLSLTLPFFITSLKCNVRFKRLILIIGIIATIAAVISSASRGGFLSLVATSAYLFLTSQKKAVALLVAGISLALVAQLAPATAWERISTLWNPQSDYDRSAGDRTYVWKRGLQLLSDHPILGVGIGNFAVADGKSKEEGGGWQTAHNSLLQISVELGIIGSILLASLTFGTFRRMRVIRLRSSCKDTSDMMLMVKAIEVCLFTYMVGAFFLSQAYLTQMYFIVALGVVVQRQLPGCINE